LWHWRIRPKIDGYRIPLLGVTHEYRNKGLEVMMINHFFESAMGTNTPYRWVDAGWILETNRPMISVLERAGLEIHRTYRLYDKPLVSD